METLRPNLILQRAPNLTVLIHSSTDVTIRVQGVPIACGASALAILEAFAYPVSVAEALKGLQERVAGVQDWIGLTAAVTALYQAGVLIDERPETSTMGTRPQGYDAAFTHTIMLNDRARTSAFFAGIREVVRPGDVVVDIGTGTGVLAVAAALAGARHVYAIEASGIGRTAKALFEANGLADRITLLPGWSTQVTLPERADVLIAEIIGKDPLGESVLEASIDAGKRLLKPDARFIPGAMKVFGLPLAVPDRELDQCTFSAAAVKRWQEWYGIDFQPLRAMMKDVPQTFYVQPQEAKNWAVMGDPVLLADVDFKTLKQTMIDRTAASTARVSGELNGVLIYFELGLGPTTVLSTHPAKVDEANHWLSLVWIPTQPLALRQGDRFAVTYRYRVPGTQNLVHVAKL